MKVSKVVDMYVYVITDEKSKGEVFIPRETKMKDIIVGVLSEQQSR